MEHSFSLIIHQSPDGGKIKTENGVRRGNIADAVFGSDGKFLPLGAWVYCQSTPYAVKYTLYEIHRKGVIRCRKKLRWMY